MYKDINHPMMTVLDASTGVNDFLHRVAAAGMLRQFIRDVRNFNWWIANHENIVDRYGDGIEWSDLQNAVEEMYSSEYYDESL